MLKHLLILFLSITFSVAFAQNKPYSMPPDKKLEDMLVDQFTVANGFPTNSINGFYQDKNSYIWLTGYEGIIRFDGLKYHIFNKENTPVFSENTFYSIIGDSKGRLYFSTDNEIFVYQHNHFKKIYKDESTRPLTIEIDSLDRLWVGSSAKGVFYFDDNKINFVIRNTTNHDYEIVSVAKDKVYIYNPSQLFSYFNKKLKQIEFPCENMGYFSIRADFNRNFWITSLNGMYRIDGSKFYKDPITSNCDVWFFFAAQYYSWIISGNKIYKRTNTYFTENTHPLLNSSTYSFFEDMEGNTWVIPHRKGLLCFRKALAKMYSTDFIVNAVYADIKNVIAVGENGQIKQLKDEKWIDFPTKTNIKDKRIRHILKDNQQQWWISAYNGLIKIDNSGNETEFLSEQGIRFTYQDNQNRIWAATFTNDLLLLNPDQTEFRTIHVCKSQILAIEDDTKDSLWIVTAGEGVFVMKDLQIKKHYNEKNGLISNKILNIHIDTQNVVWTCSNDGLSRIKNGKIVNLTTKNGLANNQIFDIVEDASGVFWMPFTSGIMSVSIKMLNDYADGKINKIECKVYGKQEGAVTAGLTPVSYSAKGTDGKLWFPATDGILMIDTKKISQNTTQIPVNFEYFLVDNDTIDTNKPIEIKAGKKNFIFQYTAICFYAPKKIRFKYMLEGFDNQWIETDYHKREVSYTNLVAGNYTFHVIACNNDGVWNNVGASIHFIIKPFWYDTWVARIFAVLLFVLFIRFFYIIRIKRLQRKQAQLEQIVKERTAEIMMQKEELVQQKEEIQTINEDLKQQKEEIQAQAEQLQTTNEKLLQLDEFKQGMTSMIVHDLKNPLNAIINTPERYTDKEKLEISKHYGRQMLNLVMNILDVNKYDETRMTLDIQSVSLFGISVKAISQVQFLANEKNITIVNNINQTIAVKVDTEIIERVFVNLLTNAIKYSNSNSEILIETERSQTSNHIIVKITNFGMGIPKDKRYLVFQKFGQVAAKNSGSVRSTGIGLTFCKLAIEAHGCEIDFDSEDDKSATFWFTLHKDQDIENVQIVELNTAPQKSEIQFTEEENLYLESFKAELSKHEIYGISDLMEIIDRITESSESILLWKKELVRIINNFDEVGFKQMINNK